MIVSSAKKKSIEWPVVVPSTRHRSWVPPLIRVSVPWRGTPAAGSLWLFLAPLLDDHATPGPPPG